jgi:hypothetical protein
VANPTTERPFRGCGWLFDEFSFVKHHCGLPLENSHDRFDVLVNRWTHVPSKLAKQQINGFVMPWGLRELPFDEVLR